MSWIFGVYYKNSDNKLPSLDQINAKISYTPNYAISTNNCSIVAGGLPETCLSLSQMDCGWIVSGLGILKKRGEIKLLGISDWGDLLTQGDFKNNRLDLNGHFSIVKWSPSQVELYTDSLELKRFYILEQDEYVFFSTRLDWLLKFVKGLSFNFGNFGSQWFLTNSFNEGSLLLGVVRLGSNGRCILSNERTIFEKTHWAPEVIVKEKEFDDNDLKGLITLPFSLDKKVTLGLSGGIDCRTILSYLLGISEKEWAVHTYGDECDLDVEVANKIADQFELTQYNYFFKHSSFETVTIIVDEMREIALHTEMTFPIYYYQLFNLYKAMYKNNYWIVDGDLGGFFRRQFGKSILFKGKKRITEGNYLPLIPYFLNKSFPIFEQSFGDLLYKNAQNDVVQAFSSMPDIKYMFHGDWVDLFFIRYNIKNCPANTRGYFDSFIPNYMPFVQPLMLSSYLNLPVSSRDNGKINFKIIKKNFPALFKFPLVRYNMTVPFFMEKNLFLLKLWAKLKPKKKPFVSFPMENLFLLKDYMYDRLNSQKVKECPYYNFKYLRRSFNSFYRAKEYGKAQILYLWLTFDFWREEMDKS